MNRIQKALSKFGLSENEAKVYVEALKHEETSPFALSKATGIPRTTVYDVLMSLSLKGLVELKQSDGLMKQQTKIRAKNPSILREIIGKRRKSLSALDVDVVEILPELKGKFNKSEPNADFKFYPGIEGVKRVYFYESESREPKVVWENLMPMDALGKENMNLFTDHETKLTSEKNIEHRELIPLTDWTRHVLSYQVGRNSDYIRARSMKIVTNPVFDNNLSITIQGSRIYISCAHKNELWGLIINSKTLSATMKGMFEVMWLTAEPVTMELVKSWGENEFLKAEKKKKKTF